MDYDLMNKDNKAGIILYARGLADLPATSSKQLAAWLNSKSTYVRSFMHNLVRSELISQEKIGGRLYWRATQEFLELVELLTSWLIPELEAELEPGRPRIISSHALMGRLASELGWAPSKRKGPSYWTKCSMITLAASYRAKVVLALPLELKYWSWSRISASEWLKEQHGKGTEEAVQVLAEQGSRAGGCFASLPGEALHL